jgi:hypothetical protein
MKIPIGSQVTDNNNPGWEGVVISLDEYRKENPNSELDNTDYISLVKWNKKIEDNYCSWEWNKSITVTGTPSTSTIKKTCKHEFIPLFNTKSCKTCGIDQDKVIS